MGKLFGTDGIRGIANKDLTAELALKTARAAAQVMKKHYNKKTKVIIAQDTRISGDMLAHAMAAGFTSVGADVYLLGVLPTPAVAYLVRYYKADIGVVISASHNPAKYNGIKLMNGNGYKLDDALEEEIENFIFNAETAYTDNQGRVYTVDDAAGIYVDFLAGTVDKSVFNSDFKAVIDCANGASSVTAGKLFDKLGLSYVLLNHNPDGLNINHNCGSTHVELLADEIKKHGADIGIAFDGDADRCLALDTRGNVIDGDKIIAALALDYHSRELLNGNKVVVTNMTNMAFTKLMEENGIGVAATKVGDRYVLEEMLKSSLIIGGEQSGHIIMLDVNTTGDGELTALKLIAFLCSNCKSSDYVYDLYTPFPQILENVKAEKVDKDFLKEDEKFIAVIDEAKRKLADTGRVIIRPSGTEPLVRIMVEGEDIEIVKEISRRLAAFAEKRILENDSGIKE